MYVCVCIYTYIYLSRVFGADMRVIYKKKAPHALR